MKVVMKSITRGASTTAIHLHGLDSGSMVPAWDALSDSVNGLYVHVIKLSGPFLTYLLRGVQWVHGLDLEPTVRPSEFFCRGVNKESSYSHCSS
ncbi:hypothetical protein J6590_043322 [Homalodisca vitripennis]|nr:hypothetical protein J6590_043322 [Homalodisca vitripennis]